MLWLVACLPLACLQPYAMAMPEMSTGTTGASSSSSSSSTAPGPDLGPASECAGTQIRYVPLSESKLRCASDKSVCFYEAVQVALPSYRWVIAVGDVDGDSNADIALAGDYGEYGRLLDVLLGDGSCGLSEHLVFDIGNDVDSLMFADIDLDGTDDLFAVCNQPWNQIRRYTVDEDRTLVLHHAHDTSTYSHVGAMASADVNNDGVPELLFAADYSIDIFSLKEVPWSLVNEIHLAGPTGGVGAADFTGDGNVDIVSDQEVSDDLDWIFEHFVLVGNGKGGFTHLYSFYPPSPGLTISVATGDFEGNGRTDFAVSGEVHFMDTNDLPFYRKEIAGTLGPSVGHFNDDTYPDLVGNGRVHFGGPNGFVTTLVFLETMYGHHQPRRRSPGELRGAGARVARGPRRSDSAVCLRLRC